MQSDTGEIRCDVGGELLLLDQYLGVLINSFRLEGVDALLHADDEHYRMLLLATTENGGDGWRALPDGPIRSAYQIANDLREVTT